MTLTQMPKVGEKVRYIGTMERAMAVDITLGKSYEIVEVDSDGDAFFIDDAGDEWYITDDYLGDFELFDEPTPVEASPTVIELLANISRRLYEAEQKLDAKDKPSIPTFNLAELNGKQLRIYTGDDIDSDYRTSVTVGIDDDTGVMYVLSTRLEALG